MLDLAGADAEGEGAEGTMRGRVAVATDDGHARQGASLLRPDDVDDALSGVAHRVVGDAELGSVTAQRLDLLGRHLVGDRLVDVGRRNVVVLGGDRQLGTPDAPASQTQPLEGLRAGDLVDEVEIDVQQIGITWCRRGADDVAVPDLGGKGCGGHGEDLLVSQMLRYIS